MTHFSGSLRVSRWIPVGRWCCSPRAGVHGRSICFPWRRSCRWRHPSSSSSTPTRTDSGGFSASPLDSTPSRTGELFEFLIQEPQVRLHPKSVSLLDFYWRLFKCQFCFTRCSLWSHVRRGGPCVSYLGKRTTKKHAELAGTLWLTHKKYSQTWFFKTSVENSVTVTAPESLRRVQFSWALVTETNNGVRFNFRAHRTIWQLLTVGWHVIRWETNSCLGRNASCRMRMIL